VFVRSESYCEYIAVKTFCISILLLLIYLFIRKLTIDTQRNLLFIKINVLIIICTCIKLSI